MPDLNTDVTRPSNVRIVRSDRETRQPYLEEIKNSHPSRKIDFKKDVLEIGRAADADVKLSSQRASRRHATIEKKGSDFVVRDNDSRNGIFLNGLRVHSAVLREGDVLQVAEGVFAFHEG